MNDKTEKKYLADKRRKYYGGTKNDTLYLFRQSQQNRKLLPNCLNYNISKSKKAEPNEPTPPFLKREPSD
jgi:hypothetical protein